MLCPVRSSCFPSFRRLAATLLVLTGAFASASQAQLSSGWQSQSIPSAPPGVFTGGMDVLPNHNLAVFDGTAIVEVDRNTGAVVRTVFTPPTFVFGSFVQVGPGGINLYFGESSFGDIYEIDIVSGVGAPVSNLAFNYDMEFDPTGRAFVSAATGVFGENFVHFVDLTNGATDAVVQVSSFSGPLDFDAAGNLYLGQPDIDFPPDPGEARVLQFTKAQIDGALGAGLLGESDATEFATGLDSIGDMSFDDEGDIYYSDSANLALGEISDFGATLSVVWTSATESPGTVRFESGSKGQFGPYQTAEAGTVQLLSSDFVSVNNATAISPQRPGLSTTPASPIPPGAFSVDAQDGPGLGTAFMLITAGDTLPESEFIIGGTPVCLGLDLLSFIGVQPISLDASGSFSLPVNNPGVGNITLSLQLIEQLASSEVVGSSNALAVTLQ